MKLISEYLQKKGYPPSDSKFKIRPEDILRKQQQFQENIDRASEGFPKFPGMQHPREVKVQTEAQPTAQPTAQPVAPVLHASQVHTAPAKPVPTLNFPIPKPMVSQ